MATVTLPGGNSIGQTFGDAGQLLSTILRHGSTVVDSYSYGYDAMGNRTSAGRTDGSQVGYGYDNVGQLTGAVSTKSDLLTVAGSLSSAPTNLTINGQTANVYGDLTYAATNGLPIVSGLNQFTAVLSGLLTNHTLAVHRPMGQVLCRVYNQAKSDH